MVAPGIGIVPFNRPYEGRSAAANVCAALASSHHSGDGPWSKLVTEELSLMLGGAGVLLTPSGTDALELACMTLGLGPGDEVVVPSFTFSSVATAPLRCGATVRFADIDIDTLGLSPATVDPLVGPRTRAVIAVHYAGRSRDLHSLRGYCDYFGIYLIEDAAHSLGGLVDGKPLGTFGQVGCLSFHETKNLSCGEGGALIVNDEQLFEPAKIIREKGTNRSEFFLGHVDKYTWVGPGSSFLMSDLSSAILYAGIEDFPSTQDRRQRAWNQYHDQLEDFRSRNDWTGPEALPNHQEPWHMYYMLAPSECDRDSLLAHCQLAGVQAVFHYHSLARTPYGATVAHHGDATPVADAVSRRLVRLPLFAQITDAQVQRVIDVVDSWHT